MKNLVARGSFYLLSLLACLAGCGLQMEKGPMVEVWRPIQERPLDPWRGVSSQVYTYVLVGEIGDGTADNSGSMAKASLVAVLAAVQVGIALEGGAPVDERLLARANQFLIPGRSNPSDAEKRVTWETFDRVLALHYLGVFRSVVQDRPELRGALNGKGPFLVSTRQPIAMYVGSPQLLNEPYGAMLLTDMSGVDRRVVGEYVRAFKGAIARNLSTSREVADLLPEIANVLARIDAAVPLIVEAYGRTIKMWSKASGLKVADSKADASRVGPPQ